MAARRAVRQAGSEGDEGGKALRAARAQVDAAKIALGERGPVWWDDGAPDLTRRMARNTAYAAWYAAACDAASGEARLVAPGEAPIRPAG